LTWQRWPRAYAVPLTFTQLTFATESTSAFPSISGDGKLVVFASDRGASGNLNIFVQAVGGEGPVQLTHSPSKDRQTDISPDGTKIVYESDRDGGGLYVLSLLSRAETRVAERGFDPRFSPDGSRIAYQGPNGRLFTVAAMGGLPQPVQSAISPALFPAWTPDGKRLLATVRKGDTGYDWMVFPLDGGRAFSTGAEAVFRRQQIGNTTHPPIPGGWIGDRIIFSAGQRDSASLWELPLSTKSLRVSGAARRLTFGPGANTYPRVAPLAAGNSRMVFVNENIVAQICSFAPEPRQSGAGLVLERLTQDSSLVPGGSPQLSADGSKLAYCSTRLGNPDVWLKNMKTGVETAVAANPWPEQQPLISPDGSRVAYVSRPDHGDAIHIWDAASGANRKLCDGCGTPVEWMPDGQRLLAAAGDPPRFQMFNATSGESQNLLPALKGTVAGAAVSPDGHWLAVTAHGVPEGCPETFIAPFEVKSDGSCKDWIPLTGLGAIWGLRWSPTGDRLYFFSSRDGTRCVWGLRVRLPGHGQTGQPFAVQHFHRYQPGPWSNSGISIAGRRLVVWFQYSQSSIWMADLR
jgi:Tol biopolymer transport system component